MVPSALERVLRRDRAIVAASLALIATMAWAYVFSLALHMGMADVDVADASMAGMMRPALANWGSSDAVFMFAMWAVMMVAMMTPSVAPMVLVHARVARQALEKEKPFAATGWVNRRIPSGVDRICGSCNHRPMGPGARHPAHAGNGRLQQYPRGCGADRGRTLP